MDIIKRHRAAVLVMLYIIAVYLYRQVSNVIELPPLLNTFLFYGRHLLIFALGICWLYRADYQRDWQQFSTKWVKNTLWVLVIFAVLYAANILLSSLPLPEGSNAAVLANRYNASEGFETVIFILVVSIIGPFNEELIFRKILTVRANQAQVCCWLDCWDHHCYLAWFISIPSASYLPSLCMVDWDFCSA